MSAGTTQISSSRGVLSGGTVRRYPARRGDAPVEIGDVPITVGRDARCTVVLRDPMVSALHAELVATPHGVRLRDLGSKNGTHLGGVRVSECFLTSACRIDCGGSRLSFEPARPVETRVAVSDGFGPLVGRSRPMLELYERLRKAAPIDVSVLILGETGTGKELVAQALHQASSRSRGPFVVLDCSSISPTLAEAVLFGHERGAFTGADIARPSPFFEADGGTLFMDEIGELPPEIQPKLLRALGERRIKPVGARDYRSFDVRVISATRRDLVREVNVGAFRSDLYFRLAQLKVELPALRDRLADLPLLLRHIIALAGGDPASLRVDPSELERLMRYDWPGNVRELKNAVWTAVCMAEGQELDIASHVFTTPPDALTAGSHVPYHDAKTRVLSQFTWDYFTRLSALTQGNISEMARLAGLERSYVRKYLRAHGLDGARRPGRRPRTKTAKEDGQ